MSHRCALISTDTAGGLPAHLMRRTLTRSPRLCRTAAVRRWIRGDQCASVAMPAVCPGRCRTPAGNEALCMEHACRTPCVRPQGGPQAHRRHLHRLWALLPLAVIAQRGVWRSGPPVTKRTHLVRRWAKRGICENRARHDAGKMAGECETATTDARDGRGWTGMDAEGTADERRMGEAARLTDAFERRMDAECARLDSGCARLGCSGLRFLLPSSGIPPGSMTAGRPCSASS